MRRGGWQREELEPNHVVIDGQGVNLHGSARVVDGGTIELEMDEDYFAPTVLVGPAGATVTIELHNDGTRGHNFFVPGQGINLHCGVRVEDAVQVVFPASGVLVYLSLLGDVRHAGRAARRAERFNSPPAVGSSGTPAACRS